MEGRYMLLSNVPQTKQASTIKKKFGKLTLATIRKEDGAVVQVVTSQRKLYFDADEGVLTDDEDEPQAESEEEEKENQIFNTQSSPERADLVTVTLKSQRISERQSTESVEFQMAKLEITQSQQHLTDDQKSSQVLFGTESTVQDTLVGGPLPEVVKQEVNHGEEDENNSIDYSVVSIVTISSTNTSAIIERPEEEVVISDEESVEEEIVPSEDKNPQISEETHLTDDDSEDLTHFSGSLPSKCSEPNCSAPDANIHPESLITSSVMRKLSDFFNKIPDLEEPPPSIDLTISETPPQVHSPENRIDRTASSLAETVDNETNGDNEDHEEVIENSQEDIIPSIVATPVKLYTPIRQPSATITSKQKQKGSSQEINIRSQVGGDKEEVINISAKIKVNIVIRTQEATTSSEDEESPPESKPFTIVKDEEESSSPLGRRENKNKSPDHVGSDSTPFSKDNRSNHGGDKNLRRTSQEIAEMDTQSNSPPNLNQSAFKEFRETPKGRLQMGEGEKKPVDYRDNFKPFNDTPKGSQEIERDRKVAEMDTEINTLTDSFRRILNDDVPNVAELDTELNPPEEEAKQLSQSKEVAEMDTVLNTEAVDLESSVDGGLDSIELDEASIAVLNSVYGSEWRTPQLMKSIKRTTTSAEMSFQPNMTDFQKFNANVQRDLESTRMEKENRGSLKKLPHQFSAIHKAKSMGEAPKTPLSIFKAAAVVQSPYFSNKKPIPSTNKKQPPLRTPLKATPKYRKILQVVDTDSSGDDDGEAISIDSDDSYKAEESESEDSQSSDSDNGSSGADKKRRGAKKRNPMKSTSRKGFDFTQIASSDSELDDTIFIDKDKVPAPIIRIKAEEEVKGASIIEGGKRRLFSDLNQHTPTSSSDGEKEPPSRKRDEEQVQRVKEKEIRFPWLHQITPVNKTAVAGIKRAEFSSTTTPRSVGKCGFLSSLDVKIGRAIADPEAVTFRELYKQKREELAEKLFKIYNEEVFQGALDQVPIKWNKKLLTTAGRCINMGKMGKRSAEVELSEKVLTSADRLRCTLIHELCHAAAWIVDAEKKGHAGHWKRWTERAVKALPELPKITVRHDYNIEYKYTYQCTKCAAKTQMHSKTKKAENIRCRFCHGDIEILLNKKTKSGDVVKTPVRAASGFALFVKENYRKLKQPSLKHADVMKLLSSQFAELKVQKNDEDVVV